MTMVSQYCHWLIDYSHWRNNVTMDVLLSCVNDLILSKSFRYINCLADMSVDKGMCGMSSLSDFRVFYTDSNYTYV